MNAPNLDSPTDSQNTTTWHARLALSIENSDGRNRLHRRHRVGPVVVQKPFYPRDDDSVHVYLVHPPGGIAGGDQLQLDLQLLNRSQSLITTPGAGKFYRSNGLPGCMDNQFALSAGSCLEFLPQENIFYPACHAQLTTRVDLQEQAQFMMWEISSFATIAGKAFTQGRVRQALRVFRQGRPLFVESMELRGDSPVMPSPWGLQGRTVSGNFLACLCAEVDIRVLQDVAGDYSQGGDICSVSQYNGVVVARYLGDHSAAAKAFFIHVWRILRPVALGRAAVIPRIWRT